MKEQYSFLIGGEWRTSDQTLEVRFPYNDEPVARVSLGSEADMDAAIVAAGKGFTKTRKLSSYQRSTILYQLLEQMEKRTDELVETLVMEGGKALNVAQGEVARAKETIRVSAEESKRLAGEMVPIDWTKAGEGRIGFVRRFPIGVIGCISPFNYPLNLSCHKIGPAIAAGNSFILKPASATPLSGLLLGEMLLETDYPREAINVLPCRNQVAQKLVTDDRVAFITFTGSSDVGWRLKSLAGHKRVTMELGGNAAAIVHEDADLEWAVSRIANGAMANAGQNCISVQRVYLHRPIYNHTLEMILDKISNFKVGDPRQADTIVGPMITRAAAEEAYRKIQDAVAKGAKVVYGGKLDGAFLYPTVLADTTPEMSVNATEMFAPFITITPYDSWEQVLAMANVTDYGLQSGIFTKDINRIMQAYEVIEVGGLQVNDVSTFRVDQMPYGGVKNSGSGREGPKYAIEEMTEPKLLVMNLQTE
jgi:acyl-CoA reductase-like NAD-dependent aldehyde dehydrogenase